ncbi:MULTISPECIES: hypothetical protein [unclassified Sphingomonas]|uniref:hypothetical protein n=1 Tax=unclassified Sphingomonas TaxID=196159 RepID=UPI002151AC5C|nr:MULTISPECIES: hypothetical protein [unclassified Sphingomonas]MCR5870649.1 hypothetical protein [Sphingomonas sp. J344]UUY01012.1 hypothetical protein LRS08_08145 [Sphingomonas sp. J315]
MREVAITLPLDVVERLIELATQVAIPGESDIVLIDLAEREVAQIKDMLNGSASAQD